MKTQTIAIVLGIVLISLASAMYSGESKTFDFEFEIVNCSITENTYDLEGLTLTWNNTNVTISTVVNYKPDNFTISCWVTKYGKVEERSHSGGRGISCRPQKDFDWNCGEWGDCINGTQTRTCKEDNNCRNTYGRPNVTKGCIDISIPTPIDDVIIIGGCKTVTPGMEDECCQNLGFEKWDDNSLSCINKTTPWWLITSIILLIAFIIGFYLSSTNKPKEEILNKGGEDD